jgi:hypothetical protein
VPSLRSLGEKGDLVAYRITYGISGDQVPVMDAEVLVFRVGGSARLDAVTHEWSGISSFTTHHASRALLETEWKQLAECWDLESLFWSTHDPSHLDDPVGRPIRNGGGASLEVEAAENGHVHTLRVPDMDVDFRIWGTTIRLLECAHQMVVVSGLDARRGGWWWWSRRSGMTGEEVMCRFRSPEEAAPETPEPPASDQCPTGMVALSGGAVTRPGLHEDVKVNGFCIDRRLVSKSEYDACARSGECSTNHLAERSIDGIRFAYDASCSRPCPSVRTCVDWTQAAEYCRKQGKRLPSDEELEWLMRHGESQSESKFDDGARDGLFWEWASTSGRSDTRILRDGERVGPFAGTMRNELYTERAERSPFYREPFLGFRCAK